MKKQLTISTIIDSLKTSTEEISVEFISCAFISSLMDWCKDTLIKLNIFIGNIKKKLKIIDMTVGAYL